jgi:hypothetical protein
MLMTKTNQAPSFIVVAAATIALMFGVACNKNQTPDTSAQNQPAQSDPSQDPAAAANLVPASATSTTSTSAAPAAGPSDQPAPSGSDDSDYDADDQDSSYGQPVLQASDPPPALPEYSQPDCPGDGYLWTPGYWSYAPQGYYWVPGAWARPPQVGYLWTPGYWGFVGGRYRYHYGFWGQHIGYYGGINYGNGYVGVGYQGGYWNGDRFNYNRSVNNVNITNVQVYNRTVTNTVVINNTTVNVTDNRSSYNGPGGVTRRPLPTEVAATREQRIPPMTTQLQARQEAAQNRQQFASVNKGRPAVLVAAKPIAEGKPIAAIVPARPVTRPPARPMAAARPAPNAEPNHAEPPPARAAAPEAARPAPPAARTNASPPA